jgi:tetratricopeptide (TPR) repeat protein
VECFSISERPEEALQYNRFAAERSPNNALANFQLGMNYYLIEQDDEALKYLNAAKSLDPAHYANPQLPLSEIYLKRGDRARAIGELEDFLARHPDAPNAPKVREAVAKLKQ